MSSYIIEVASVWRADSSPYSLQQNETVPILSMQTSKAIRDKNINCTELNMFCIGFFSQICSCITAITKINTTVVALAKFVIRIRPTSVFILGGTIIELTTCFHEFFHQYFTVEKEWYFVKIVLVIEKKLLKFEAEGREFAKKFEITRTIYFNSEWQCFLTCS